MLTASQISKSFQMHQKSEQKILKTIDLTINRGEFVSIMGASGSGKSTLLYTLSGMLKPTSGEVTFCGQAITNLSEKALTKLRLENMGFIFQDASLLSHYSLFDNIILSAYLGKTAPKSIINSRASSLMKQTGIAHLAHHDITQASGGQLQRVAICRALINQPEMIFGDEPTGALNSKATSEIMALFSDINLTGTTILLVTHDIKVASKTERILYLSDGAILSEKYLGKFDSNQVDTLRQRELQVLAWLEDLGF